MALFLWLKLCQVNSLPFPGGLPDFARDASDNLMVSGRDFFS
jgi:hypothetical protein